MELIQAKPQDFERLRAFYIDVIENTPTMRDCCRWIYGLHPTDLLIKDYIAKGFMHYYEDGGEIVAAIALCTSQDEDYHDAPWQLKLDDGDVAVGHLVCVSPARHGQGIAKKLLNDVFTRSAALGKRAYRFDTLGSNTPAQKLYDSLGCRRIAVRRWYACNVGEETDFILYEKLL